MVLIGKKLGLEGLQTRQPLQEIAKPQSLEENPEQRLGLEPKPPGLGSNSWLEYELARELNPAGRAIEALSFAEVAVGEVSVWAAQTGMVERVEHLGPELEIKSVV